MTQALQAVGSKRDINSKTAQMVKLITEIGPDIPEIARRLGQYKESVRYRYKEKVLNRGFAVQAAVDFERLGLRRVVFIADFAKEYRQYANAILTAMSELCYVVYFGRTMPEGSYIAQAAVPTEHLESFRRFIRTLREKGLFTSAETFAFEWARNPPMQAEYYDFNLGRWDFDWSGAVKQNRDSAAYALSKPGRFDYVDLLMLKELQKDANKTMTEIAGELKVNYKKLMWHYVTHVIGEGMIKSYRLNWMGTTYDFKIEKALNRKHRYHALKLIVKDLSAVERMQLMSKLSPLPFLWFEAAGPGYYADFTFPVDSIAEAYGYLEKALEPLRGRYEHYVIDTANALTFTLPYQLYDQNQKRWTFSPAELVSRFEDLLMKIREGG